MFFPLLVSAALSVAAAPQDPAQQPEAASVVVPEPSIPEQYPDYEIGPGDILRISVSGHEDLSQTVVVQADGTFIYPLIGVVKASDMKSMSLATKIATLLANGYIRDPQVTVIVDSYRSKKVLVIGAVSKPGSYPLAGENRVMEMLAMAGGSSSNDVVIIRPRGTAPLRDEEISAHVEAASRGDIGTNPADDSQADLIHVDLGAIQAGELDKNIQLLPNDTVYVPPAPKFFVTGEANNGVFGLPPNTTVREAITIAGGFGPNASKGRIRIIRRVDGEEKEFKVKLDDIVQPGDTIVIKASWF